jgi:DNA helicase-2/ATP-dependent DNA helicase PcrA
VGNERIANLIKTKKANPQEILALTFTEKAAQEMADRVEQIFPDNYSEFWISTFHAFCERVLKNHGLDIGLSTNFRLLDQVGSWLLIRQNLDKFDLDYYKPLGNPTKFIHALVNHFSRCKDEGITPEQYLKYSEDLQFNTNDAPVGSKAIKSKDKSELACLQDERDRIKEVANAFHTYQRIMLENNCLDFADLINYCLILFQKRPLVLKKFRDQFKYILVDEFQDTNWAQYELAKQLAYPKNNITVCGDDDQSVYRWRGASFNNVLQFRKDFPNTKEVVLTENYRSCQDILDISHKFIQLNNPNRLEYQINEIKEISRKAKSKGVDLTKFKKIDKRLKAKDKSKARERL